MKLSIKKNSLFAILLRSPWWISIGLATVLALLAGALLPKDYRVVGALSGFPFVVIGVIAARRQWRLPSAAQIARTEQALSQMNWPAFAKLLEQTFVRDGHQLRHPPQAGVDFQLERQGRTMLIIARRWKSARTGIDALRQLQAARLAAQADDALYIGLGELTENALPFALEQRITIWRAAELAQQLRGMPLSASATAPR